MSNKEYTDVDLELRTWFLVSYILFVCVWLLKDFVIFCVIVYQKGLETPPLFRAVKYSSLYLYERYKVLEDYIERIRQGFSTDW